MVIEFPVDNVKKRLARIHKPISVYYLQTLSSLSVSNQSSCEKPIMQTSITKMNKMFDTLAGSILIVIRERDWFRKGRLAVSLKAVLPHDENFDRTGQI